MMAEARDGTPQERTGSELCQEAENEARCNCQRPKSEHQQEKSSEHNERTDRGPLDRAKK